MALNCKLTGFSQAVGYWGGDPACRLAADQTAAKERALLQDELLANGLPATLWQPVSGAGFAAQQQAGAFTPCTCDKNTTQSADYRCLSCYGVRIVPGYLMFSSETLWYASAEAAVGGVGPVPPLGTGWVLTNVVIDRAKKPNRLTLADGALAGSIVTAPKTYSNPSRQDWALELMAFRRTAGDTVTLEVSLDGGLSYTLVPLTGGPFGFGFRGALAGASAPIGTGSLLFRITLARASLATPEAPSFEILRVRHGQPERLPQVLAARPSFTAGQILVLRTWDQEKVSRDVARGRLVDHDGDSAKTAPLDFFDTTLGRDTPPCAIDDRGSGPHPFYEYSSGVRGTRRYVVTQVNLDTTVQGLLTHQTWLERRAQDFELYSLVF